MSIKLVCRNPVFTNFKQDGSQDEVSQMIISILSLMANFERQMILQRQREGNEIAIKKGLYRGRKVGTQENEDRFMEKARNQKILSYLNKRYRYSEISKIVGCSF
jgi:DNA invertase Pin-like site-specific DNA recombinase